MYESLCVLTKGLITIFIVIVCLELPAGEGTTDTTSTATLHQILILRRAPKWLELSLSTGYLDGQC